MNLTKPAIPNRPRASRAYVALTCVARPSSCPPVNLGTAVAEYPLDPVNREIGSLPINALAIALALRANVPMQV
jgi:hypothetical protein